MLKDCKNCQRSTLDDLFTFIILLLVTKTQLRATALWSYYTGIQWK